MDGLTGLINHAAKGLELWSKYRWRKFGRNAKERILGFKVGCEG